MRTSRQHTAAGVGWAVLVAAVQLGSVAWVPLAHAMSLTAATGPAVEDIHSSKCAEVHVETRCRVCASTEQVWLGAPRQLRLAVGLLRETRPAGTEQRRPVEHSCPSHPARGPPASPLSA